MSRPNAEARERPGGARALFCAPFMSLWPLPNLSAPPFVILSPLLVFCSMTTSVSEPGRRGVDGQTTYILYLQPLNPASLTDIFTTTAATANHYFLIIDESARAFIDSSSGL